MLVASDKVRWEVVPIIKGGGRVGFLVRKESAQERNGQSQFLQASLVER